jgi:hypothetical protein
MAEAARREPLREPRTRSIYDHRRLLLIVWPFLAIVVLLVLLAVGGVDPVIIACMSAAKLVVKAQRMRLLLNDYARSRSPNYQRWEAIAVPLGMHRARRLENRGPGAWRYGFVVGRNAPTTFPEDHRLFCVPQRDLSIRRSPSGRKPTAHLGELVAAADDSPAQVAPAQARTSCTRCSRIDGSMPP